MIIFQSIPDAAAFLTLVAALVLASTQNPYWERTKFKSAYLEVTGANLPPGSLVLLVGNDPVSYAIPHLRPDARFVSVENNFLDASQTNLLEQRVRRVAKSHNGPIFLLSRLTGLKRKQETLRSLNLAVAEDKCEKLNTNIADEICIWPLSRLAK